MGSTANPAITAAVSSIFKSGHAATTAAIPRGVAAISNTISESSSLIIPQWLPIFLSKWGLKNLPGQTVKRLYSRFTKNYFEDYKPSVMKRISEIMTAKPPIENPDWYTLLTKSDPFNGDHPLD